MASRAKKRVVEFQGQLAGPEHAGEFDLAESLRVGDAVNARLGQCYRNAMLAAQHLYWEESPDGGILRPLYVEGYAVLHGVPIEHGWLLVNGAVVDPTAAAFRDGVMFERYAPVLVWRVSDMARQAAQQGALPLGDWFTGGWETGTLGRREVASAWQTVSLRLMGYTTGTAADFYKERGL